MTLLGCGERKCKTCLLIPLSEECDKYTEELEYIYAIEPEKGETPIRDRFLEELSIKEYLEEGLDEITNLLYLGDNDYDIGDLYNLIERYELVDIVLDDYSVHDDYLSSNNITLIFNEHVPKGVNLLSQFSIEDLGIYNNSISIQIFS